MDSGMKLATAKKLAEIKIQNSGPDARADKTLDPPMHTLPCGKIGDGKSLVSPVDKLFKSVGGKRINGSREINVRGGSYGSQR